MSLKIAWDQTVGGSGVPVQNTSQTEELQGTRTAPTEWARVAWQAIQRPEDPGPLIGILVWEWVAYQVVSQGEVGRESSQ